jgi:5-(carboxyamino)imidazole ribonucleotide synthase
MVQSQSTARPGPLEPIGVVGGGQLAWMLATAARELNLPVLVQTPHGDDPATRMASGVVQAPLHDLEATRRLAARCSAITFENEWLDLAGMASLAFEGITFLPSLSSLEPLISKHSQRLLLERLGLPSPAWRLLADLLKPTRQSPGSSGEATASASTPPAADLEAPDQPLLPPGWRFPLMAKAASGGYDGKGTRLLRGFTDLRELLTEVDPHQWIVEAFVSFELELSQLACRDRQGRVLCYPLVQTHQHHQVCDWVLTPAGVPHAVQAFARNIATSLLTAIDYVGVLSIELFYGPEGLLVNEIAPRTHNSGHVTIEANATSQFSQQARIVAGLPMGAIDLQVPGALMVNLLGFEYSQSDYADRRAKLGAMAGASLHWYAKRESTPGRKLGHLTLRLEQCSPEARQAEAMERLAEVRGLWPLPWQERCEIPQDGGTAEPVPD